jgi:hypothetical protein
MIVGSGFFIAGVPDAAAASCSGASGSSIARMSGLASSRRPSRFFTAPDSVTMLPAGMRFSMPAQTLNQRITALADWAPSAVSVPNSELTMRASAQRRPRAKIMRELRTFATNVARTPSASNSTSASPLASRTSS